ncbi:MAG: CvpA family protein [Helicobacteraceae bacterium]|jgi:membrane protein required for colicin V production|nr:CvpA family protein [Helicobacteraceae bacterium]
MTRALMVWLDRMLGFLLGAAKVFVLFSIIVYALSQTTLVAKWLEKNGEEIVLYRALNATGGFLIKLDIEKPVQTITEKAKETVKEVKESVEKVDEIVEEITDKVIEGGETATDLVDSVKNNESEGE